MPDVATIVLAAGLSRRMGAVNKLLEDVGGTPLLCRVCAACDAISDHPVTVVTGHQSDAVRTLLRDFPVRFVHNEHYTAGQMTSVDAGLRAAPVAQTYLLALGDQPRITAACLQELLEAHHTHAAGRITVPFVDGMRGNPIVIPAYLQARMLADAVNPGCRNLTRRRPELVHRHDTQNESFLFDIDTAEDLARARGGVISEVHPA